MKYIITFSLFTAHFITITIYKNLQVIHVVQKMEDAIRHVRTIMALQIVHVQLEHYTMTDKLVLQVMYNNTFDTEQGYYTQQFNTSIKFIIVIIYFCNYYIIFTLNNFLDCSWTGDNTCGGTNGNCEEEDGTFSCVCTNGFSGEKCDTAPTGKRLIIM